MSKAKISDVRQGVTLYYVHAFPHKGFPSYIDTIVVTERPKKKGNSTFSMCNQYFNDELGSGVFTRPWSLKDAGIIPNSYNFHSTFTSLKSAKRYAERMNRVCLTAPERVKYRHKILNDLVFNDF
jgi:hypothetical protein